VSTISYKDNFFGLHNAGFKYIFFQQSKNRIGIA